MTPLVSPKKPYFSTTSVLCDRYSGFPPTITQESQQSALRGRAPRVLAFYRIAPCLKALANEDTLLRTHCSRHKCFPVCPRAQHLLRTQKMFPSLCSPRNIMSNNVSATVCHRLPVPYLFIKIFCPQQMFPSLRSPRNIMSNHVSATMCPRLPLP